MTPFEDDRTLRSVAWRVGFAEWAKETSEDHGLVLGREVRVSRVALGADDPDPWTGRTIPGDPIQTPWDVLGVGAVLLTPMIRRDQLMADQLAAQSDTGSGPTGTRLAGPSCLQSDSTPHRVPSWKACGARPESIGITITDPQADVIPVRTHPGLQRIDPTFDFREPTR